MSDGPDKVQAFYEKLLKLVGHHAGHFGVQWDLLQKLVRQDPEAVAGAIPGLIRLGKEQRGFLQLAFALAVAYQEAFQDDSLTRVVQREMARSGIPEPTVAGPPVQAEPDKKILQLGIDRDDLARCDVYPFTRMLSRESLEGATPDHAARMRNMRGRCLLAFPSLDADSRAVWNVPEARAYVRALFEAMPYFPYYLHTHPAAGTFMLFFGCLADPEALSLASGKMKETADEKKVRKYLKRMLSLLRRQGKAAPGDETQWQFNILHPSVTDAVAVAASHLPGFCRALGDDPAPVLQFLLAPYPETLRQQILSALETA